MYSEYQHKMWICMDWCEIPTNGVPIQRPSAEQPRATRRGLAVIYLPAVVRVAFRALAQRVSAARATLLIPWGAR